MSTTAPIAIPRTSHATLAASSEQSARLGACRPSGVTVSCTRRHGLPVTVSATSLDVDGVVRAMVRPSVPNYALRRLLVGTTAAVALAFGLVAAVGVSAGVSGSTASAAPVVDVVAPSVHVAQAGDTMWSIANTYRGEVDRDRYIGALINANGGVDVQAGSAVLLP